MICINLYIHIYGIFLYLSLCWCDIQRSYNHVHNSVNRGAHVKWTESRKCLQHGSRNRYMNKDKGMNHLHTIYIYTHTWHAYLHPICTVWNDGLYMPILQSWYRQYKHSHSLLDDHRHWSHVAWPWHLLRNMPGPLEKVWWCGARLSSPQMDGLWIFFVSDCPPKKMWKTQFLRKIVTNGGWFFHIYSHWLEEKRT